MSLIVWIIDQIFDHKWVLENKTLGSKFSLVPHYRCARCGATKCEAGEHDWEEKGWNCQQSIRRCRVCGLVEMERDLNYAGQGDWGDPGHTITWEKCPNTYWGR